MDRKKIHELLDLILEIQERGKGKDGYPYVNIEFSNYGGRILFARKKTDLLLIEITICLTILQQISN